MKEIELKLGYDHIDEIKELFMEYTNMLIDGDPKFKQYLEIQNYDDELLHLEKKYGLPKGRLYLLYYHHEVAGCIALRTIDDRSCELKRLYIKPKFRGLGLGKYLVETIIQDAKEIGYQSILLDTLPFLQEAISLYKKYRFYEIPSYNNSPMDTSIYMKLDLIKDIDR